MGKNSKARREAKNAGRADLAGARERAKRESQERAQAKALVEERFAREQALKTRIREHAARDDPAILQELDAEIGPAWVYMALRHGSIPHLLNLAMAAKCLSFFIKAVAREAGPRIAKKSLDDPDNILYALLDGVFHLDLLAVRLGAGDPRQEEIRDAIRGLFQHLPPEGIEYLKKSLIGNVIKDHFEHVLGERFAQSETLDIINAIGDAGLPKEGEPERRRPPGPRDGL